jgi:iodotyrosine deiodinase
MKKRKFIKLEFKKLSCDEIEKKSKDFYEFMDKRRTVREISREPLSDEIYQNLILTAATAPSGANQQPWTFCLVKSPSIKKQIREEAEKIEKRSYEELFSEEKKDAIAFTGLDWHKAFLEDAPALIIVFKHKYQFDENGDRIKVYYPNEGVGLAIGMLFTAIHSCGLVTTPYTPHPITFLKKILNRPDNEAPVMILPIGLPKDDAMIPDKKRKPLDQIMIEY